MLEMPINLPIMHVTFLLIQFHIDLMAIIQITPYHEVISKETFLHTEKENTLGPHRPKKKQQQPNPHTIFLTKACIQLLKLKPAMTLINSKQTAVRNRYHAERKQLSP